MLLKYRCVRPCPEPQSPPVSAPPNQESPLLADLFYVRHVFINAEFLSQSFHCQQMLPTNGIVINARVKFRQFNRDINWRYRISANQMNFGMVDLFCQFDRLFDQFSLSALWYGSSLARFTATSALPPSGHGWSFTIHTGLGHLRNRCQSVGVKSPLPDGHVGAPFLAPNRARR